MVLDLQSDVDGDGVIAAQDNCATLSNADQANRDGDPLGDACDDDTDGDGVPNGADQCVDTGGVAVDADGDGCPDGACLLVGLVDRLQGDNEGVRNSLRVKAVHACGRVEAGDWQAARGSLRALANETAAQSGRHLLAEQAEVLRRAVENATSALPAR